MKKIITLLLCGVFTFFISSFSLQTIQSSCSAADLQHTYSSPMAEIHSSASFDRQEALVTPPPLAGQPQQPRQLRDLVLAIAGSEGSFTAAYAPGATVESLTRQALEEYPILDFDYGREGRWSYSVNGEEQSVPPGQFSLEEGDSVLWHPTSVPTP